MTKRENLEKVIKTIELNPGNYKEGTIPNHDYLSNVPIFALCTNLDKAKKSVTLISSFNNCREMIAKFVYEAINFEDSITYKKLPTNRTCVLALINAGTSTYEKKVPKTNMTYKEWVPKCFGASLKLINHYEKRQKWAQTKMYKVNYEPHSSKKPKHMIYCFIGSKWWINSPHLFSLFNLFIRLGRYEELWPIKSNSSHEKVVEALGKIAVNGSGRGYNDYTRVTVDKWEVLFNNFKKIHKGRETAKSNWKRGIYTHEGIYALTTGQCRDETLQKRFNMALTGKL